MGIMTSDWPPRRVISGDPVGVMYGNPIGVMCALGNRPSKKKRCLKHWKKKVKKVEISILTTQ